MAGVLAGVAFLILLALGFALVLGFVLAFALTLTGAATLNFLAMPPREVTNDLASLSASAFLFFCIALSPLYDCVNRCFLM